MDDNSPKTKQAFVEERIALSGTATYRTWGVHKASELGGLVTFQTAHPGDTMGWAHTMFKKAFRPSAQSLSPRRARCSRGR